MQSSVINSKETKMTRHEFNVWRYTALQYVWSIDFTMLRNQGCYLLHAGGNKGQFVMVDATGKVTLGCYFGDALEHITDAYFRTDWTKQFETREEAFDVLIERAGLDFLRTFKGMHTVFCR